MSHSRVLVAVLATLLFAGAARPAPEQKGLLIDAIATLDYVRGRSIVNVGSWVKHRMKASSELGATDDYTVTVLIAGEEEWWGEECFWIETTTQRGQAAPATISACLSFSIFDDSLATRNALLYERKFIAESDEQGRPVQQTMRRGNAVMKSRTPSDLGLTVLVDTLGTDTLKTALGDFVCLKVRTEQGTRATAQSADSTQYTEIRDVRVSYMTPRIPVTGCARQEVDYTISRRTWLTGRSQDSGPLMVMDRTKGVLELVGYGTEGVNAVGVPEEFRRPLAEQRAAQAPRPRPPAAKPRTRVR